MDQTTFIPSSGGGDGMSSYPEMTIELFNVGSKKTDVKVKRRMRNVLLTMVSDYRSPLFVLCQDKILKYKHEALLKHLKFDHDRMNENAGVYYRPSKPKRFVITYLDLETYQGVNAEEDELIRNLVAHMAVCMVTLRNNQDEKFLLVSWDGQQGDNNPSTGGQADSNRTFQLLDRLQDRKGCMGAVVIGNFDIPEGRRNVDGTDRPNTIVYWPGERFDFTGSRKQIKKDNFDHDVMTYTCRILEFTIAPFNMKISGSQETTKTSTEKVVGRIKRARSGSLFVFCADINKEKRDILCNNLHSDRSERKKEAAVYYQPSDQYKIRYVYEETLKEVEQAFNEAQNGEAAGGDEYFTTDRLMACVLTPTVASHDKILLVSWHGPHNQLGGGALSADNKVPPFEKLVRYLDCLKRKMKCKAVVVGGDFNLPYALARTCLVNMNATGTGPVSGAVHADYKPSPRRQTLDKIDYIVCWPQNKFQTYPIFARDDATISGDTERFFDHDIIRYTLKGPTPKLTIGWSDGGEQNATPSLTFKQGVTVQIPEILRSEKLEGAKKKSLPEYERRCLELISLEIRVQRLELMTVLHVYVQTVPGTAEGRWAFVPLICFLEYLKEEEECHVVVVSGNLSLTYGEAQKCLEDMKFVDGALLAPDAPNRPPDSTKPYCVSWPRNRLDVDRGNNHNQAMVTKL